MDYNLKKDSIRIKNIIFEGCQEQPIDIDFTLPDYCPDIQRILKCQVYPQISSKNISSDRLDVEGNAIVKLLYVDSTKSKIRCFQHTVPFSMSFNLKDAEIDATAIIKTKVEYVNCRAVSSRRVDIHGAFSICAKVIGESEQELLTDISAEDIQQKKVNSCASSVIGMGQQKFSVAEVLELGQGKPNAETIVRTDVSAIMNDYKTIANKVIVKGEALIKILYSSSIDDMNLEIMEYSIPISQIIDVSGINEDCICNINMYVMNSDIEIRQDTNGENHLFDVDIKICATVVGYRDTQVELITDAYSTKYELETSYKQTDINKLIQDFCKDHTDKSIIRLQDKGVSKIIDVWNEIASVNAKRENDKIIFNGKYNICMLGIDSDEEAFYIEKMMDFECDKELSNIEADTKIDSDIIVTSVGYHISSPEEIEVRVDIKIPSSVYGVETFRVITEIKADENAVKPKDEETTLTIYYADKGENVWNIARKYCTSVDAIKLENNLTDDILQERGMLLIPM